MKNGVSDIALLRREQIIEAAIAVIAEQGIQNLSLSEIETRADMSRGQLIYYFKTKESILLAVFDHILEAMYKRLNAMDGAPECMDCRTRGWELIKFLLRAVVLQPSPEFGCLQYTFLAQVGHREDYRQRLATLYEDWRSHMAECLSGDQAAGRYQRPIAPRALATVVQALLHGLVLQAQADPGAYNPQEVLDLCLDMLGNYLGIINEQNPKPRHRITDEPLTSSPQPRRPSSGTGR
jgi:AcrR family transcriptional regulator